MPSAEPVVVEVGRYTAPRLRVASVGCLVAGALVVVAAVVAGGVVALVLGLLAGVVLAGAGAILAVAARANRGARLVVDEGGITWDAGAATWHADWDELTTVGVTVLRGRVPRRGAEGPEGTRARGTEGVVGAGVAGASGRDGSDVGARAGGRDRVVRLGLAFARADADAGSAPLRRLRAADEAPFTHRMAFASRGEGTGPLDDGLRRFAGERYAGLSVRDARGRPVA